MCIRDRVLASNGQGARTVAPGEIVDIGTDDSNLTVTKSDQDNNVRFGLSRHLDVDSVTTGNSTLSTGGLTVRDASGNATTYGASGFSIAGGPSILVTGIDAGGKVISNVANGVNAGDAVNKGQLDAVAATAQQGSIAGNNANATAVKYAWNDANGDGIAQADEIDTTKVELNAGGQSARLTLSLIHI